MGRGKKKGRGQATSSNSCQGHIDLYKRFAERSAFCGPSDVPELLAKGITLLHSAAREGDIALDIAQIILDCGCIPINSQLLDGGRGPCGRSPLFIASRHGQAKMVKLFLEQEGINVNIRRKDITTPLIIAASNGHLEVVKLLLACKDIDVSLVNDVGYTALHCASAMKTEALVRLLVEHKDIDVNLQDKGGCTAILVAVKQGHVEVVKTLLGCVGIDVNKRDSQGATPLMMAAMNGHFAITKMFLESNLIADINDKDNMYGRTALFTAVLAGAKRNSDLKTVNILLKYKGIDVNQQCKGGLSPLMIACLIGDIAIVNILLACKDIDLNLKCEQGFSGLHVAVVEGHTKVVEMLLDKGVDVNAIDIKNGQTALYPATQKGHTDMVKMLLDKGVDVNAIDNYGQTALHFATQKGRLDVLSADDLKIIANRKPGTSIDSALVKGRNHPNHPKIAEIITKQKKKIKRKQREIEFEAEMQEAIAAFDTLD